MKKKVIVTVVILCVISAGFFIIKSTIGWYLELKEKEKIRNAIVEIELTDDLTVPFATKTKVSDFITSINGELVEDYSIDTTILGDKEISFEYVNDDGIKIPYSYKIEIIDDTPPLVWLFGDYYVTTSFTGKLESVILCADDHDDEPTCRVEGTYDTRVPGTYSLNFHAEDESGNVTDIPFKLQVSLPSANSKPYVPNPDKFEEIVAKFKNENASFGIDVSSWQGDIDFQKVKDAGVEFAIVRVGSKWGREGDYFLDAKFERNIEGFNEVGIPVGAYFYSYAKDEDEAREDAEWLLDKIKDYKIDLPIAFDFEDWTYYNDYKMSLYRLNRNAEVFIETIENAGYQGMLYGSINYLNKIWNIKDKLVWGAHYTTIANYRGILDYWQISSEGLVPGVPGYVDIDIMYR